MSRYAPSEDSYSRYAPSSPMSYADEDLAGADSGVLRMRLKVLYTTDDKTNCMARWPKALQVRSAFLDDKTEIGVVDLRTCIKAIVTSSPELVAKLGRDYTVYAYDYSEHETPLVGQGMLSWVLASSSSSSTANPAAAPPSPARTMVTGRVTKNMNALFGRDSVSQTLEVKLRLVPVPTILQSDYIDSMKRYRDISRVMPDAFDPQGWTDFLKANPQVLSTIGSRQSASPPHATAGAPGLENVQRLVQQGSYYAPPSQAAHSRRGSFAESVVSRGGSPTPSVHSAYPEPHRPMSQASNRGLRRTMSSGQLPNSDYEAADDGLEDGPARKRARVTQIKRPRKNAGFGNQVDSLRVAASTANSVRVMQPTAVRPGMPRLDSLEEPPRAPTPVPLLAARAPRRVGQPPRSGLSRYHTAGAAVETVGNFQTTAATPQSSATSPGANSVLDSSPGEDPGSSPPVPVGRHFLMAPSSPRLPHMPPHEDSGFMSGNFDDEIEHENGAKYGRGDSVQNSGFATHDETLHGTKPRRLAAKLTRADSTASQLTAEERASELSRRNALRAIGWRRVQSFSEGQTATSDTEPSKRTEPLLQRQSSVSERPISKHAYDKQKQKERVNNRLMNAIAAGEKPPMCENCGTVQSQTWRKAYKRRHSGSPSNVRTGRGPGAILTVLIEERNADGEITLFSIVKKKLAADDEGFQDVLLCNPCGLWLASKGEMRPPRIWNSSKNEQLPSKESYRDSNAGTKRPRETIGNPRSALPIPSECTEPPSEALEPFRSQYDLQQAQQAQGQDQDQEEDQEQGASDLSLNRQLSNSQEGDDEPELPVLPEARYASQDGTKRRSDPTVPVGSTTALQRAVRSSPGQIRGSKHSPIDVETTPDRTRRTLFPSPKTHGPLGISNGNRQNSLHSSPDAPQRTKGGTTGFVLHMHSAAEKENMMPPPPPKRSVSDSLLRNTTPTPDDDDHDFFGDMFKDAAKPSTPSRNSYSITLPFPKSPSNIMRTPTKTTPQKHAGIGNTFSLSEKDVLHGNPQTPVKTPSRRSGSKTPGSSATDTPFTRHLKNLFSTEPALDMDTSPSKVFGDLPALGAEFTDWPMTTDMPMPSSPPVSRIGSSNENDTTSNDINSNTYLLKTPGAKGGAGGVGGTADADEHAALEWEELGLGKTPAVAKS